MKNETTNRYSISSTSDLKRGRRERKKKEIKAKRQKENFLSRYSSVSQSEQQLLFAVAGESREEAENGKLFNRATTQ